MSQGKNPIFLVNSFMFHSCESPSNDIERNRKKTEGMENKPKSENC